MSSEQLVTDFLNQILDDAGMTDLPPEVRQQMLVDLRARLEDRFLATIISVLKEDQLTQFRELTEQGAEDKVAEFINTNIPNSQELFAQAMVTFKEQYLGATNP